MFSTVMCNENPDMIRSRNSLPPTAHVKGSEVVFTNGIYSVNKIRPFRALTSQVAGVVVVHLIGDSDGRYCTISVGVGEMVTAVFDKIIQSGTTAGILIASTNFWM